jgi:hypothetical protein
MNYACTKADPKNHTQCKSTPDPKLKPLGRGAALPLVAARLVDWHDLRLQADRRLCDPPCPYDTSLNGTPPTKTVYRRCQTRYHRATNLSPTRTRTGPQNLNQTSNKPEVTVRRARSKPKTKDQM